MALGFLMVVMMVEMVEAEACLAVGFVGKVQIRDRSMKLIFTWLRQGIGELGVGDELRLLVLLSAAAAAT